MLYYTPQTWCSDNTDAVDRLAIQYGTSFAYPACTVGSHVSACPNHQTGRTTPIATRGVVASSGVLGYELDLNKLSEQEKDEVRKQITAYRKDAPLIMNGLYYRLSNPKTDNFCAWEYVSENGDKSIVSVVTTEIHGNMPILYVNPRGLTPDTFYKNIETGKVYPANALMDFGFPLPQEFGEYKAYVYHFERL
jgi:alpha-galactosidase